MFRMLTFMSLQLDLENVFVYLKCCSMICNERDFVYCIVVHMTLSLMEMLFVNLAILSSGV